MHRMSLCVSSYLLDRFSVPLIPCCCSIRAECWRLLAAARERSAPFNAVPHAETPFQLHTRKHSHLVTLRLTADTIAQHSAALTRSSTATQPYNPHQQSSFLNQPRLLSTALSSRPISLYAALRFVSPRPSRARLFSLSQHSLSRHVGHRPADQGALHRLRQPRKGVRQSRVSTQHSLAHTRTHTHTHAHSHRLTSRAPHSVLTPPVCALSPGQSHAGR